MPGFTALLTGLDLAAAELGGELPLVITVADEEVTRVPVRAVKTNIRKVFKVFSMLKALTMSIALTVS